MKEVLIAFVAALIIGAAMNGLSMFSQPEKQPQTSSTGASEKPLLSDEDDGVPVQGLDETLVKEIGQDEFNATVLEASKPVFVDFYADWCGPCKQMAPVVAKLASQYDGRIQVFKVNIDKNPKLVAKYNIMSIPTFMIFKNGASAETFAGSMPRSELAAALDKQLN